MPVKRRTSKLRPASVLTPFQRACFLDRPRPEPADPFWQLDFDFPVQQLGNGDLEDDILACWREHRSELMREWLAQNPGRRPSFWWQREAPRQPIGTWPGCYYDGRLQLPRERLGGIGTPSWAVFNVVPSYWCGLPAHWVTPSEVRLYSGRARDINGQVIMPEFANRPFAGRAIDPRDPPRFESQASYLKRLGLLLPGEERRLRPADFEPELVMPDIDDDEPLPVPQEA